MPLATFVQPVPRLFTCSPVINTSLVGSSILQHADDRGLTQEPARVGGLRFCAAGPLWQFLQTQPDQTVWLPWSAGARPRLQDRSALDAVMIGVRETVVVDRQARAQHLFDNHGQAGHHLLKNLLEWLSDEFCYGTPRP